MASRNDGTTTVFETPCRAVPIKRFVRTMGLSRGLVRGIVRGERDDVFRVHHNSLTPWLPRLEEDCAGGCLDATELWRWHRAFCTSLPSSMNQRSSRLHRIRSIICRSNRTEIGSGPAVPAMLHRNRGIASRLDTTTSPLTRARMVGLTKALSTQLGAITAGSPLP